MLKVGRIAVDGTKIQASASKHAAVSYKRAGEKIEELEADVAELLDKAERADATPLDDGLTLPGEVARRRDRIEKLKAARAALDEAIRAAGRSPADVQLTLRCNARRAGAEGIKPAAGAEAFLELAERYAAAGVDALTLDLPGGSLGEAREWLQEIGERVVPAFR